MWWIALEVYFLHLALALTLDLLFTTSQYNSKLELRIVIIWYSIHHWGIQSWASFDQGKMQSHLMPYLQKEWLVTVPKGGKTSVHLHSEYTKDLSEKNSAIIYPQCGVFYLKQLKSYGGKFIPLFWWVPVKVNCGQQESEFVCKL